MNRFRPLVSAAILSALAALSAPPAEACSCAVGPVDEPCLSMEGHHVFSGRVTRIEVEEETVSLGQEEYRRHRQRVRFEVEEAFRGIDERTVEVWTGLGGGDCGFEFEEGGHYLVYAYPVESEDRLHTSICSRTRSLAKASEDLAYARLFRSGQARTRVLGTALHSRAAEDRRAPESEPLTGAKVYAVGSGGATRAVTVDGKGSFELELPKGGRYEVTAEVPEGLPAVEPATIEVAAGTCAWAHLEGTSLAQVSGRVLTAQGDPVAQAMLTLRPLSGPRPERFAEMWTDGEGTFHLRSVVPGEYRLVVNDGSYLSAGPRVFFPGTVDPAGAEILVLAAGEKLDVGFLTLPGKDATVVVRGLLRKPEDVPFYRVKIAVTTDGALPFFPQIQDSGGDFGFHALPGRTYRIQACLEEDPDRCSAEREVIAGSGDPEEVLRLEIPPAPAPSPG